MDFLIHPWPWYVAGPLIALVMFLLLYFGESFGMSSNLRTICSMAGGGKATNFFRFDWKSQQWNLVFLFGAVLGGFLSANYLTSEAPILLNPSTVNALEGLGFAKPTSAYLPKKLFGVSALQSLSGISILLFGGFLVGFGARYAGGCTSGHAISGLSNLQVPSLLAVIGFFIGGLTMVHLFFPLLF